MTKKALVGILMSLFVGGTATATNKIAKFDSSVQKVTIDKERSWKSGKFIRFAEKEEATGADVTLGPAEGYSIISGPDGTPWYATQTYTAKNSYYSASTITLFNGKGEQQGVINVTIPEDENVNQIMIGDIVSTSLFDKDANTMEIPVITHQIISPGVTSYYTHIYDIASGTLKHSYKGHMVVLDYFNGYKNEWIGVLSGDSIVDGKSSVRYDIYTKPGYSSNGATLKKTFTVPKVLAEYQIGSVLNLFVVDNKPYYIISNYEKEYLDPASYEEPWDMIPTADNNFVATIYDQNFKETGTIKIPVVSTQQKLMQFGIGLFGVEDLSRNYWDASGNMELVVTTSIFNVIDESEDISFDVYDVKGNKVKNIASNVGNWMKMYDVPGQLTQMAMLSTDGSKMAMVDLPQCETVIEFGSEVDGEAISTNIDRYTVGAGYQYVVALPMTEVDADKNFIQRFAWITTEGEIANQVKFNLGKSNASWIPLVMGEVMNPYVFDTDDMREYVFIANQYASGTTGKIVDELRIVKEDGTPVRVYTEDATKGDIGICNILGFYQGCPTIIVPFLNSSTDLCTVEIDFLPFNKFSAGGDGSADNPYLISSIGDMGLMSRDLSANYKIAKDFDAAAYGPWQPTDLFTGTLDGDNHTISNLYIESETVTPAIFSVTENATVKNLKLYSPEIYAGSEASSAGIIASSAVSSTFSNIKVFDAIIDADSDAKVTIGGIVGTASLNSTFSECYNADFSINAQNASPVGGIVGDTRTGTIVNACAASGTINARSAIGGIVGSASTDCVTTNCHANTDLSGQNTIGGIVGSAERGGIHACIAEGTITATKPAFSDYIRVGGITGQLTASYSEAATDGENTELPWNGMVVSNNVVNISSIEAEGRGAHRIVGFSRWDEDIEALKYDNTIEVTAEHAINENYAVNPADILDTTGSVTAQANTTEGATLAATDFTAEMLASLKFNFGNTADAPWTAIDNTFALYFEDADYTEIGDIEANNDNFVFNGNEIRANAETRIELFNINGIKIASGCGIISTENIPQGIYIVMLTDTNGNQRAEKVAIK